MDLAEKQALVYLHWDMDTYENSDYYHLSEILSVKEAKDRPVDPMTLL